MRQVLTIALYWIVFSSASAASLNKEECFKFFHKTVEEQKFLFRQRSIAEQYELFIFGNQVIHPPAKYLARSFAELGPEVIPYLKEKLIGTDNELTVRDIALILVEARELGAYDVSNQDVVFLLDQKSNNMKGPWKIVVRGMLERLR